MIGLYMGDRCCRTCAHVKINTGYPGPVCYEKAKRDGKPVATSVKLTNKACFIFKAREDGK